MTAAAFTIFWMKIKLEWHSIIFSSLGAVFGMVVGLDVLDALLDPPTKKLGFVCIWFSFAFALFLLNRYTPNFKLIQKQLISVFYSKLYSSGSFYNRL